MATGTYSVTVNAGGLSIGRTIVRNADGTAAVEVAVPASPAGTLTTRTDNETGTITMASGSHGITTASVVDLFWSGGARFGVTVGTVSGTTVPIGADNSGTGDNLPIATTALVVSPRTAFNVAIDGDEALLVGIEQTYAAANETAQSRLTLLDAVSSAITNITLAANTPRAWDLAGGDANSFTGNPIASGRISNGSSTNAATLRIAVLQDATP